MSCPERINDIDLDTLDQNFILSTPSDSNNAFQGSFIRRFWSFLTGKNEKNNSFINLNAPNFSYDLPLKFYESYIFYEVNFEKIDDINLDSIDRNYLLITQSIANKTYPFLQDFVFNEDIELKEFIFTEDRYFAENTFNRALVSFEEQSWLGDNNFPTFNYINYKLPPKIYFELDQVDQNFRDNDLIINFEFVDGLNIFLREDEFDLEIDSLQKNILNPKKDLFIDSTPPTLISSDPVDDAIEVPIANNIILNFSEDVNVKNGNIVIHKTSDNSIFETIDVNSKQVTGTGTSQITINPTNNFSSSTEYYLIVEPTAFDDLAGNSYLGISDSTLLSFTTIGPTVTSVTSSNPNDIYNADDNIINIQIDFSEDVEVDISNGTPVLELETGSTNRIATYSSGSGTSSLSFTYTVQPGDTSPDLEYTNISALSLNGGNITDPVGNKAVLKLPALGDENSLAGNKDIVIDTTPPILTSSVPADDEIDVAVDSNIVLTFSEVVDVETGNIVIYKTSDNSVVETIDVTSNQVTGSGTSQITINPTNDLESLTEYYLKIDATAFDDPAGNSYAGIDDTTSLSFTTPDIIPPTLTSSDPADNATAVAEETNIVLNFSEDVEVANGNIVIYKTSDDSVVETIDVTSNQVTGSGTSQITINPTDDLESLTEYYLKIDATAFDDLAGNSYVGINDTTSLSFTTGDTVDPILTSSDPADNEIDVAVDSNIVLTFSEVVDVETGNIVIYKTSDDSVVETIDVTSNQVTGSGTSQITINPTNDFESLTEYYLKIDATAFDDPTGNSYAGIDDTTSLSFTTPDIIPPTLTSSDPADNATAVAEGSNIVLNFSEAVDVETGNIVIYKTSDNSVVETIDVTSNQVTGSGTSQITINPTDDLESLTEYYLKIDATAFDDLAGNSYVGIDDTTSLSFTTGDTVDPILTSSDPADDEIDVAVDSNIVLTFSEVVDVETGNIVIYKTSDDSVVETIDVTSNQVTGSGTNQITINPTNDLESLTEYYLKIDATAFDDPSGNSYAGISDTTSLSFTTPDIIPPTLTSSVPADDATAVAEGSNIVLNFSEAVDVETGNIVLYKTSDNSVVETFDVSNSKTYLVTVVSDNGNKYIFDNSGTSAETLDLAEGGTYIFDQSHSSNANHPLRFYTSADKAGGEYTTGVTTNGIAGSSGATVTITVASSSPTLFYQCSAHAGMGGQINTNNRITGSGTSQITLNPTDDLESLTEYYLKIDATAFDDLAGNSYVGIDDTTSLSFTTGDTVEPILTSSDPADNEIDVAVDSNIVLTFSEVVDVETGNIVIYKTSDDSVVETIDVTSNQVTGSGTNQITINPTNDLESLTEYYLKIDATAFDDPSGNSYAGISDTTSLSFTTPDIIPPTLTSSVPADDAILVNVGSDIVLNFSEVVDVETGNIVIYKTSDNSVVETIDVTSNQVTGSGTNQITINPTNDLESLTEYYLKIDATAFDDQAGNSYVGIDDTTSLSFTTGDAVPPTLTSSVPVDNATAVAEESNIVLNFSEAVDVETGNIVIYKTSDNSVVETIDVTSNQVTGSGTSQITINPTDDLDSLTEYYLKIDATAFDDPSGNSYAGISDTTSLSFTTGDTVAPTLTSSDPADDATAVAEGSNIVLNFSEVVDVESGNIVIYKTSDNSVVETIDVTSNQVTGSGTSQITINPTDDLEPLTEYYLKIDATAFDDPSGNSYAGISDTTSLSFTTGDTVAPTLTSSDPADNATAVAEGSNIVLNFSEVVDVESGNIVIYKTSDNSVVETIDVTSNQVTGSGTNQITINPTDDLDSLTEYYLKIDATAFDDPSGNSYAGIADTTSLSFTTGDTLPPTLTSSVPIDDATFVAINSNIVLTFSEVVDVEMEILLSIKLLIILKSRELLLQVIR